MIKDSEITVLVNGEKHETIKRPIIKGDVCYFGKWHPVVSAGVRKDNSPVFEINGTEVVQTDMRRKQRAVIDEYERYMPGMQYHDETLNDPSMISLMSMTAMLAARTMRPRTPYGRGS